MKNSLGGFISRLDSAKKTKNLKTGQQKLFKMKHRGGNKSKKEKKKDKQNQHSTAVGQHQTV